MELKIDYEFKRLCRTLTLQEHYQLEQDIKTKGCRNPVIVWNGYIVDGYEAYNICQQYNIPFLIEVLDLDCREALISWLCNAKLQEHPISDERRKFLIGMQYDAEIRMNMKRRKRSVIPYSPLDTPDMQNGNKYGAVANRVAEKYHIAGSTAAKYCSYAKALLRIEEMEAQLFSKILSGEYKISHENVVAISKLSKEEIKKFNKKFTKDSEFYIRYNKTRKIMQDEVRKRADNTKKAEKTAKTIKDMPDYDPSADVVGLSLTIPSWCDSIYRISQKTDFDIVSDQAKYDLLMALFGLCAAAEEAMFMVKGDFAAAQAVSSIDKPQEEMKTAEMYAEENGVANNFYADR